ncbi:hypothetical protein ACMG5I_03770 [Escherichia coli]|uniref:hypothetical protein n=1 Tax=Escherichia coli TaxID=562 RepID=UPI002377985E|nr:hypothetical protein vBEcoMphAPEC6_02205 [Escherichia phage ph0011]
MLNPGHFFHLLDITPIPDLISETNHYRDIGIVSMEYDSPDFKCYVTYDQVAYESEPEIKKPSYIFVFIYNDYSGDVLNDVHIDTFEICGNIISDDSASTFDLELNSTEESLFQLSTICDTILTLDDIEKFKEQLDAVREMFYNHYPEVEFN